MAKNKPFNETTEFKAERKKWYARLDAEGFEDIEKGETDTVIRPQIIKVQKSQYDGGNSYYELCQNILREFRFKKEIHRVIFSQHTEGRSEREIVNTLANQGLRFSQKGINLLINRVKEQYLKGTPK